MKFLQWNVIKSQKSLPEDFGDKFVLWQDKMLQFVKSSGANGLWRA